MSFPAVPPAALRIDTHAHVFARGLPMADVRRYTPAYDVTVDEYLARLDAHGMSHGVLVQPSFLGSDNDYLLQAIARAPQRLRGIAMVDADIGLAQLQALQQGGVVGIRLNLVGGAPLPDLRGVWHDTLTHIAAMGWQVEIHREAADLPLVLEPLLALGLNVVVDHFGRVDAALGVDDPGFGYLLSIAASRQVWVKLSAQYRNGGSEGGARFARRAWPLLRRHFGVDRLLWGSDWPHTQHESVTDYGDSWRRFEALVSDEQDRRRITGETAAQLFRFG
ncbi:metal-dependent transmembrane hydrolase [Herbaspirillum sp. GW103]|uniref:amidohydrolase family protein n=1 Tax=unclassified Herbaspirillum TaxID=2624150 RepID=UPI00025E4A89|nr:MULTISPECIES: amidohydrolase family protein [unclassified Herbaspirillum]EIJ44514.1 metal-dependent transmembrane hydrolase [Herbaspirillum sp. GW103]MCI1005517.1 amidohydrolase family protein [Herbaspirillum sp. C7C8]